ncbi:MAG TPA: hypothetical protein VGP64_08080, partial [Polyangia bacterium]
MSSGDGKAVGAALVLLGLGLCGGGLYLRGHLAAEAPNPDELKATAATVHARLDEALKVTTGAVESKASAAARLPEIASALDLDADSHTFEDLLSNEDWWASYRAEFAVNGVVSATGRVATTGPIDGELAHAAVVEQARDAGAASGVVMAGTRAFLLAAARVPAGKRRGSGAVVVLGTPFGRAPLQAISDAAGATVGLSDGHKLLAFAGVPANETALSTIVGHEADGVVSVDESRAAGAWPLDRELSLVALFPVTAAPPPSGMGTRWALVVSLGGLLVLVGALLAMRRRPVVKSDLDNPMVITQPFGSEPKVAPVVARGAVRDVRGTSLPAAAHGPTTV